MSTEGTVVLVDLMAAIVLGLVASVLLRISVAMPVPLTARLNIDLEIQLTLRESQKAP